MRTSYRLQVLCCLRKRKTIEHPILSPVNVAGQQHELLKQEPPFEQPAIAGQSGSKAAEMFLTRQVVGGPQPAKHAFVPSALQV